MACLEAVAEFYACNSQVRHHHLRVLSLVSTLNLFSSAQLHVLVVDKLIRMQIVDAVAVFNWLFSEKVTPHFTQQYVWDILESTVLKTNRSHDQAIKQLADTNDKLKKVNVVSSIQQF